MKKDAGKFTRRDFIRASAAGAIAAMTAKIGTRAYAAGSDKIRIGLIGCGGRGSGAVNNCINADPSAELVAMGDVFKDRIDKSLDLVKRGNQIAEKVSPERIKITPDTRFGGFDAYQKVLACDVDVVILATPPHFRPMHLRAAVEAGKHVFMEKPVAVDPVGVRSIIASSELAEKKGLAIVAGTMKRHQTHYIEVINRVHRGDIGNIVGGQCYYNTGGLWIKDRQPSWSDMEWQCRNWLYFTWLSGDHIVEQHVHNIDVMNWAMGSHPTKCLGIGGRGVRTDPKYGNIFDHFTVEYEYPSGARIVSMCRQMDGCSERVSERVVGTKGTMVTDDSMSAIEGQNAYKHQGEESNPYVQEHADLIASIRQGKPLNEGRRVAESTLTAIMGRMSAYTGRELSWDWVMNASKLDLTPAKYEFGDLPVEPVAIPGKTKLI